MLLNFKHLRLPCDCINPLPGYLAVLWVDLEADEISESPCRNNGRRSGPGEGVEDRITLSGSRKHTRLDHLRGKGCEVCLLEWLGADGPDAALIAGFLPIPRH